MDKKVSELWMVKRERFFFKYEEFTTSPSVTIPLPRHPVADQRSAV
jgi:hypothetical protein